MFFSFHLLLGQIYNPVNTAEEHPMVEVNENPIFQKSRSGSLNSLESPEVSSENALSNSNSDVKEDSEKKLLTALSVHLDKKINYGSLDNDSSDTVAPLELSSVSPIEPPTSTAIATSEASEVDADFVNDGAVGSSKSDSNFAEVRSAGESTEQQEVGLSTEVLPASESNIPQNSSPNDSGSGSGSQSARRASTMSSLTQSKEDGASRRASMK